MPKPLKISTLLIVVLGIVMPKIGFSQTDSSAKFVFSAYAEPYFSFDLTDRSQKLKAKRRLYIQPQTKQDAQPKSDIRKGCI
jgi:hypothetical protein